MVRPKDIPHLIELLNKKKIKFPILQANGDLIRYLKKKRADEKKYSSGEVTFP